MQRVHHILSLLILTVVAAAAAVGPGTVYFGPGTPRFPTSSIEFRDATGELWPAFFHGRATADGKLELTETGFSGAFGVACTGESMLRSATDRRIIGELLASIQERKPHPEKEGRTVWANEVPMPIIRITQATGTCTKEEGKKGPVYDYDGDFTAVLEFVGRKVPLKGTGSVDYINADGAHVIGVHIRFTTTGQALGLTELPEREVVIDCYTAGKMAGEAKKKKKKKRR